MNFLGAECRGIKNFNFQRVYIVIYRSLNIVYGLMSYLRFVYNPLNPPLIRGTYIVSPIKGRLQRGVIHNVYILAAWNRSFLD